MSKPNDTGSAKLDTTSEAPALRISVHDSIHMIHREDWEHVASDGASIYLRYDYLRALEDAMGDSMQFRYVIHYCPQNRPLGIAYFQVVDLVDNGSRYRDQLGGISRGLGSRVLKDMRIRCLVNGNVFHCGDHGSYFSRDVPDKVRFWAAGDTLMKLAKADLFEPKVSLVIVKDLGPEHEASAASLTEEGFHTMAMDLNMVMEIDPAWRDSNDYQEALNAKARTRLRSVVARSGQLVIRDLSSEEIRAVANELQALFDHVLNRSPFLFGRLKVEAYAEWKKQFGEQLMFRGFYLNGELVGFSSAFVMGETLDAHYVGFDDAYNQEHLIYQRMLVDLLEFALARGLKRIRYGRTAEQAKSNLGSQPLPTCVYVRHRNALASKIIGPFARSVKPDAFEQRSPFKKALA